MRHKRVRLFGLLLMGGIGLGIMGTFCLPGWVEALGLRAQEQEPPEAVKALIETLKDKDAEVRKTAVLALGRIGAEAKGAVPALIGLLKDDSVDVRGATALTLG